MLPVALKGIPPCGGKKTADPPSQTEYQWASCHSLGTAECHESDLVLVPKP